MYKIVTYIIIVGLIIVFFSLRAIIKETQTYKYPKACRECELLGICRRPEEEGGKCYHGCLVLNSSRQKGIDNENQKRYNK